MVYGDRSYYVLLDREIGVLISPKMARYLRVSPRQLITAKRSTFQSLDRTLYLLDHHNIGNLSTTSFQYIISIPIFLNSTNSDCLHLLPHVYTKRAKKKGDKQKEEGSWYEWLWRR
jgi:hypothetical protein